ncbi:MAG: hypothetical protein KGN01_06770 [Patescibacteria group bacterium]|nr:hypothetical protein [Patescibacteria group bacterium]
MEITLGAEVQYLGFNGTVVQKKRPNYVYSVRLSTGQIVEGSDLSDPFFRLPAVLELQKNLDKTRKNWLPEAILQLLEIKGPEGLCAWQIAQILDIFNSNAMRSIRKLVNEGRIEKINKDNIRYQMFRLLNYDMTKNQV